MRTHAVARTAPATQSSVVGAMDCPMYVRIALARPKESITLILSSL